MTAVATRCAPLVDRAAPSLMPAMDIRNSGPRATFWELWDPRRTDAPTVAKYSTDPSGLFLGGLIVTAAPAMVELLTMPLDDFIAALSLIEAEA